MDSSMAVVHQYPPNYAASLQTFNTPQGPIVTTANWPPGITLSQRINGLMNCVFAYGGATLFNELMAEMRRPYVKHTECPMPRLITSPLQIRFLERLSLCGNLHFRLLSDYWYGRLQCSRPIYLQPCVSR